MISNFWVMCPGCDESLRLRISIGREPRQRFYFVCPLCESAVPGVLETDQDAGELRSLVIDGRPAALDGEQNSGVPVINLFADLPVDPSATSMLDPSGSPFMMHLQRLGDDHYGEWTERTSTFDSLVEADWRDVVRWWGFYEREDWSRFDEHATRIWSDNWPSEPTVAQRHDAVHRAIEAVIAPIFPGREYLRWKTSIRAGAAGSWQTVHGFATNLQTRGVPRAARSELFDVINQFVEQRHHWRPGLIIGYYAAADREFDPNWRVTRDDYRELRDLFINVFERSHRYIPELLAFSNALDRADADLSPDGQHRSQSKLKGVRAVEREKVLKLYQPWGPELATLLDRQLRNAIGHGRSRHSLEEGSVLGPKFEMPYPTFVSRVATSIQVPLLLLDTIKTIEISTELDPS